jgi:chromosome segregation ATPase
MAISNNTTGASIYDLGRVVQSQSISELNSVMKASEEKVQQQMQQEQAHQQKLQEQEIQARAAEEQAKRDQTAAEKEKDRRRDILVAEIRAAGFGAMQDVDQNLQSDYVDYMDKLQESERYQAQTSLQRDKMTNDTMLKTEKLQIEREKLQAQREIAEKQLQVAKENKNKYDFKPEKNKGKE